MSIVGSCSFCGVIDANERSVNEEKELVLVCDDCKNSDEYLAFHHMRRCEYFGDIVKDDEECSLCMTTENDRLRAELE